jgi:integrase
VEQLFLLSSFQTVANDQPITERLTKEGRVMARIQKGYIKKSHGAWFGVWYQDELTGEGTIKRIQKSRKLASYGEGYRCKRDVRPLLDEILAPLNSGKCDVRSTMSLADFVEKDWLPHCERELRPATIRGYKDVWKRHIKPYVGQVALRDIQAVTATDLLARLRQKGIGHRTLRYVKALGSAICSRALAYSILQGANPFALAELPRRQGKRPAKPQSTIQDVWAMLQVLKDVKARAAIALTFFGGLVPSEARGTLWENYDGQTLKITQSVWRKYTGPVKTEAREAPIPIVEPLRCILSELRIADGSPTSGPILRGKRGKPLNLDNLNRRVIAPSLKAVGIGWHGFRPNRTGVSTIATALAKDNGLAAKGLLRHSQLATTDRNYIQTVPAETLAAMSALELEFARYGAKMEQIARATVPN